MSTPKPGGEPRGINWMSNPGKRNPKIDVGLQFGPDGGMTRTGNQTTETSQSPEQAAMSRKTKDLQSITDTIAYNPAMQKLTSIPGNVAHSIVLDPEKPLPWAEADEQTYLVVLTAGKKVGVMQMSSRQATDEANALKDLLSLATNMGLPKTPDRRIDTAAGVHATIVGGKKTDPLRLFNVLQEYVGVSEITRLAGGNVAVTQDGQLTLVTDVPQHLLTPPRESKTTPPVIATGRRYQRGL